MTLRTATLTYMGVATVSLWAGACPRARVESLSPVACTLAPNGWQYGPFTVLGRGQSTSLSFGDWRRPYVGSWQITMTVDSARTFGHQTSGWRAVQQSCSATGLLQITDTLLLGREDSAQVAQLEMDFSTLYGGPFVWSRSVSVRHQGKMLQLDLCPGCLDEDQHNTGIRALLSPH